MTTTWEWDGIFGMGQIPCIERHRLEIWFTGATWARDYG